MVSLNSSVPRKTSRDLKCQPSGSTEILLIVVRKGLVSSTVVRQQGYYCILPISNLHSQKFLHELPPLLSQKTRLDEGLYITSVRCNTVGSIAPDSTPGYWESTVVTVLGYLRITVTQYESQLWKVSISIGTVGTRQV